MDKFHYEANGYNRSEVNAFIERVIRETEGIINKCQEQKDEIKDLIEENDNIHFLFFPKEVFKVRGYMYTLNNNNELIVSFFSYN